VPAYVILHDRTLAEIARVRPRDTLALASIAGIGRAKLARYGEALLEVVQGDRG
jgi:ATP-dependent DNA helicase RecQ